MIVTPVIARPGAAAGQLLDLSVTVRDLPGGSDTAASALAE